ncbi:hypothetical protein JOB18_003878 [Solea senegalensis]|uniref:Uncharacterized protein n=1 Tax=Solea senegalensis TaxID=28829 RepID=A0AAV6SMD6_SOLSE|nr:hypothetical protein JOB18_003878 [Solea senegalensis]
MEFKHPFSWIKPTLKGSQNENERRLNEVERTSTSSATVHIRLSSLIRKLIILPFHGIEASHLNPSRHLTDNKPKERERKEKERKKIESQWSNLINASCLILMRKTSAQNSANNKPTTEQ